jgi:hypothetical protein
MACRGWRTPYPQKRQQTLGATWDKPLLLVENRSKPRNNGVSAVFSLQKRAIDRFMIKSLKALFHVAYS